MNFERVSTLRGVLQNAGPLYPQHAWVRVRLGGGFRRSAGVSSRFRFPMWWRGSLCVWWMGIYIWWTRASLTWRCLVFPTWQCLLFPIHSDATNALLGCGGVTPGHQMLGSPLRWTSRVRTVQLRTVCRRRRPNGGGAAHVRCRRDDTPSTKRKKAKVAELIRGGSSFS